MDQASYLGSSLLQETMENSFWLITINISEIPHPPSTVLQGRHEGKDRPCPLGIYTGRGRSSAARMGGNEKVARTPPDGGSDGVSGSLKEDSVKANQAAAEV